MNCEDKMTFDTEKQAQDAARVADYQRGANVKPYRCTECELWHLSSANH